jgi:hypothetical protein
VYKKPLHAVYSDQPQSFPLKEGQNTMLTDTVSSALIGVGGVVIAVIANLVGNLVYRRTDFEDKRFFEAYSRRLAVYEDVIKELASMMDKHNAGTVHVLSGIDMSNIIIESLHTLNILISRLCLYGSPGSVEQIISLHKQMFPLQDMALDTLDTPDVPDQSIAHAAIPEIFTRYIRCIEDALRLFRDLIAGETGKNLVDEKIMKADKKTAEKSMKIAKRMTGNNNSLGKNTSLDGRGNS